MKQKTFALLLAIALFVCIMPYYSGAEVASPHNMPSWSNASQWATAELKKANDAGLIPDILNGADLTKAITREEFAELAVRLYEKSTNKAAIPASPNPFPDTSNPEILKAYKLGVTTGITTDKGIVFSPDLLINREQCATMLYRALKAIVPGGEYSIVGIKDFPDQKHISSWAVEGTKYLAKLGIIKGDANGNFMPKAVTSEQEAAGYGAATREAAILMSVRSFEQIKAGTLGTPTGIDSSSLSSGSITPPAQQNGQSEKPEKTTETPTQGTRSSENLIGEWSRGGAYSADYFSGNIDIGTMSIVNGEYYQFNADGTYQYVISSLGGTVGFIRYDSQIVYMTGTYKVDVNTIIFSNNLQTYYKGTPLVLVHKDKKVETDNLEIEEFDFEGGRFKTMMGWFEKKK